MLYFTPGFAVEQWTVDQVVCVNGTCSPYDRRIAYNPVLLNATAWNAMKYQPFNLSLISSKPISGVSTSTLVSSCCTVMSVTTIDAGRSWMFTLQPIGTG